MVSLCIETLCEVGMDLFTVQPHVSPKTPSSNGIEMEKQHQK